MNQIYNFKNSLGWALVRHVYSLLLSFCVMFVHRVNSNPKRALKKTVHKHDNLVKQNMSGVSGCICKNLLKNGTRKQGLYQKEGTMVKQNNVYQWIGLGLGYIMKPELWKRHMPTHKWCMMMAQWTYQRPPALMHWIYIQPHIHIYSLLPTQTELTEKSMTAFALSSSYPQTPYECDQFLSLSLSLSVQDVNLVGMGVPMFCCWSATSFIIISASHQPCTMLWYIYVKCIRLTCSH